MFTVIIIMLTGMLIGHFITEQKKILSIVDKLTNYAIYLLLFILGLSVGTDNRIMDNLHTIGLSALVIACASVLGSVLIAYIIYKRFFQNYEG